MWRCFFLFCFPVAAFASFVCVSAHIFHWIRAEKLRTRKKRDVTNQAIAFCAAMNELSSVVILSLFSLIFKTVLSWNRLFRRIIPLALDHIEFAQEKCKNRQNCDEIKWVLNQKSRNNAKDSKNKTTKHHLDSNKTLKNHHLSLHVSLYKQDQLTTKANTSYAWTLRVVI